MNFTCIMSDILLANGTLFDKLKTHKQGLKHYAFSVFLFNKNGELLLQKRAINKYHSGGLWSNTCCSHFRNENEFQNKEITAIERLKEKLGIDFIGDLQFVKIFEYQTQVGDLIENEIDYIFTGEIDDDIANISKNINKNEAEEVKFMSLNELKNDIKTNSELYTEWLKLILNNNIF